MADARPLVLFNWHPPRGLDRVAVAAPTMEVRATDDPAELAALLPRARVLCVADMNAAMLAAAPGVAWIHSMSAGVNHVLFPEMRASPVPLTCLKGCFDVPGAEYALGVMLAFARRLAYDIARRTHRTYKEHEPIDLCGKTVGIIGLGGIGLEVARRARCFGMQVAGLARRPRGALPEIDELYPAEELYALLAACDFVVVTVPLTDATRGFIGAPELAAMRTDAYLIDVSGRPAIYDLDALRDALVAGRLAGASLQMVPDPDSPLWDVENLILSYHRTTSREQFDRCIDQFCENLRRFQAGEPLLGLVDKEAGY